MHEISNNTNSISRDSCESKNYDATELAKRIETIKNANNKIPLYALFKAYNIVLKRQNYTQWSKSIICPLPQHKSAREHSSSFAYNFVSDYFHCFGCHKSGRAVEFLSFMQQKSKWFVAKQILLKYGNIEDQSVSIHYIDNVSPILIDASTYFNNLIQNHKNDDKKIATIEKFIFWIDSYLVNKAPKDKIKPNELQFRINKVKELLNVMLNSG